MELGRGIIRDIGERCTVVVVTWSFEIPHPTVVVMI
jgi:hypothetical protein